MGIYRRTVSFPNPPPPTTPAAKSYHVRSASLPCNRPHPLLPQLLDDLHHLRSWASSARFDPRSGSTHVLEGLSKLKTVLHSLDDVFQLPQTQDSLSSRTTLVENLLEDLLRFVDAYGIFQTSALALRHELSASHVALRRKDPLKLSLHVKAQNKIAGEIGKLISAVPCTPAAPNDSEGLRLVILEVHRITASVSAGLFGSVASWFGPAKRPIWEGIGLGRRPRKEVEDFQEVIAGMRRKGATLEEEEEKRVEVMKRVKEIEDCVGEMERESERVFRSLISTRVSLLNILTHA